MLVEITKVDFEFSDDRGSLKQLVHQGWNQVNYIESKSGSFRGDHYHKKNIEAFFVIKGEFKLVVSNIEKTITEEYIFKQGDFFKIHPLVVHSFYYTQDTQLISFYNVGVENSDGSKDILSL